MRAAGAYEATLLQEKEQLPHADGAALADVLRCHVQRVRREVVGRGEDDGAHGAQVGQNGQPPRHVLEVFRVYARCRSVRSVNL